MSRGGAASTLVTGAAVPFSVLFGMAGGLGLTRLGSGEVGADIVQWYRVEGVEALKSGRRDLDTCFRSRASRC